MENRRFPVLKSSVDDLAIHGGKPAFEYPLHVGSPNVTDPSDFLDRVAEIVDRNWLTNDGPVLRSFEREVRERSGARHCVAMVSGSIAITATLQALGVTGEVIMPSYTFVATAHATTLAGAIPVFADIEPGTHHLDPAAAAAAVTSATQALMPVHLWGGIADVDAFEALGREVGVPVLYDAAHAFGCRRGDGRQVGSFGAAEILSFHATKFLNSIEGGAVLTNDDELAENLRHYRNFGFVGLDDVVSVGTNAKMSEVAAAMGLSNLTRLDELLDGNSRNLALYRELLSTWTAGAVDVLTFPGQASNCQYVVAVLEPVLAPQRDAIVESLRAENILARRYFWPGCHRFPPYNSRTQRALPVTEDIARRVIVLPTGPGVSPEDIDAIARILGVLTAPADR